MLRNARVIVFTVSELLKESQKGGGGGKLPPPTQIRIKQLSVGRSFGQPISQSVFPLNFRSSEHQSRIKCTENSKTNQPTNHFKIIRKK